MKVWNLFQWSHNIKTNNNQWRHWIYIDTTLIVTVSAIPKFFDSWLKSHGKSLTVSDYAETEKVRLSSLSVISRPHKSAGCRNLASTFCGIRVTKQPKLEQTRLYLDNRNCHKLTTIINLEVNSALHTQNCRLQASVKIVLFCPTNFLRLLNQFNYQNYRSTNSIFMEIDLILMGMFIFNLYVSRRVKSLLMK